MNPVLFELVDALRLVAAHLALLLGPLVVAGVLLHQLNVLTTRVLGESFGSGAVLLSGLLGSALLAWSLGWARTWLLEPRSCTRAS